jgi:hypothetical protein
MTPAEYLADPKRLEVYRKWCNRADTKQIIPVILDMLIPTEIPDERLSAERALRYSGAVDQHRRTERYVFSLDLLAEQAAKAEEVNRTLGRTDYGAEGAEKGESE